MHCPLPKTIKQNNHFPKTVKNIFKLAWKQADGFIKRRLFLTLVLVLGASIFTAFAPVALKLLIDGMTTGNWHKTSYIVIGPALLILMYLFSLWLSRSLGEIRGLIFGRADQRLQRRLSRRLFSHVMQLPLKFHLDRKTGALNQTLVNGLAGYQIILQHVVFSILPTVAEMLLTGIILSKLYQPVFLIILGLSIIAYTITFAVGVAQVTSPGRQVAKAQVDAYATLTDSLLNYETVKYFNAESHIHDQYDGALSLSERKWSVFYGRKMINGLWIAVIFALSLGTSMVMATGQVIEDAMTVGDFILINAYMLQIVRPLETLGFAFRDIAHGVTFAEKLIDFLKQKGEPSQLVAAEIPKTGKSHLTFDRVSFSYAPDLPVLKDISFTIEPGKTLAIVGPSGAGKSSIIRLLYRLFEPESGEIRINDQPITEMPLSRLRQSIAVVPQDTILFNDTIGYNIGFGKPDCEHIEIEQAARLAHVHDRVAGMPDGYRTIVGERGLKLSGGEKQRISIARAALKKPQLFVFDEATSSLDTKTEQGILENLINVSEDTTTLTIAHRLSTVVHADEILLLDRGTIVEKGSHISLLQKAGFYAAMWRAQQQNNHSLNGAEMLR